MRASRGDGEGEGERGGGLISSSCSETPAVFFQAGLCWGGVPTQQVSESVIAAQVANTVMCLHRFIYNICQSAKYPSIFGGGL